MQKQFGQRCLCMFILCIECKTRTNTTKHCQLSICYWSCFCVWQYFVVLPGSILRCVKIGYLRWGCECLSLQAAPPACRLSPLALRLAAMLRPPPLSPQPYPVALPWPDTNGPSYLFLCKKTRGWGPLLHFMADLGMSTLLRPCQTPTFIPLCTSVTMATAFV